MKNCRLLLLAALMTACIPSNFSSTEDGTKVSDEKFAPDPDSVICNPFDTGNNGSSIYGLSGSLYYLTPDQPRYGSVRDYIQYGNAFDDTTIYMNRVFVPTRAFDRGFFTEGGELLTTANGDTLYEYFALRMKSRLRLHTTDAEGAYQLAVLSDDGSILSVDTGAGLTDIVSNDLVTPTKMKCSTVPLVMTRNSKVPMQLDYFQGPRYHIAMVVMWRPFPTNPADVMDPLCEHVSNDDFFDSTQDPSTPQWAYNDLLSRGWKPLETQNYLIEDGINPCTQDR